MFFWVLATLSTMAFAWIGLEGLSSAQKSVCNPGFADIMQKCALHVAAFGRLWPCHTCLCECGLAIDWPPPLVQVGFATPVFANVGCGSVFLSFVFVRLLSFSFAFFLLFPSCSLFLSHSSFSLSYFSLTLLSLSVSSVSFFFLLSLLLSLFFSFFFLFFSLFFLSSFSLICLFFFLSFLSLLFLFYLLHFFSLSFSFRLCFSLSLFFFL